MSDTPNRPFTLRELSLPTRLTLAVFLVTVGLGYFAALLNLRAQEGRPGELMPSPDDVVRIYHRNDQGTSQLERLLEADPSLPFNGQGSMRAAFTRQMVGGWEAARRRKAEQLKLDLNKPDDADKVDRAVSQDLEGERLALVHWVRAKLPQAAYDANRFALPESMKGAPITERFVETDNGARYAKVRSILEVRCARCHDHRVGGPGSEYPLKTYDEVARYGDAEGPTGKSVAKLALSTHVHLLGTTILFALSGLLFSFTGYPALLRAVIAPLPLLAFLADVACQWLARLDPPAGVLFARTILLTGALVGGGLGLQVLLGLWAMFAAAGRAVLVLLILLAGGAGYLVMKLYFEPMLQKEKDAAALNDPARFVGPPPESKARRVSTLERLLEAPAEMQFNIEGSMRAAFTTKLSGRARWDRSAAATLKIDPKDSKALKKNAGRIEKKLMELTEGERRALVAWVRGGLKKQAFDDDRFELTGELAAMPITPDFVEEEEGKRYAKVKSIFDRRCTRCHTPGGHKYGGEVPLRTYDEIADYFHRYD